MPRSFAAQVDHNHWPRSRSSCLKRSCQARLHRCAPRSTLGCGYHVRTDICGVSFSWPWYSMSAVVAWLDGRWRTTCAKSSSSTRSTWRSSPQSESRRLPMNAKILLKSRFKRQHEGSLAIFRLHRGLVQPASPAFCTRLLIAQ